MIDTRMKPSVQQHQSAAKQLVLFDFDGTLTTRDTLAEFIKYYRGNFQYYLGLAALSPVMALYVTKLIKNWKAKQYFLGWYLKGEDIEEFNKCCVKFATEVVPNLIRPGAIDTIRNYKASGSTVAIVSASAENWVKPFCDSIGILCLGTKLETRNGKITGNILGKNCHGPEKVCRIKEAFDLSSYTEVIAYGDTSGDREMLALANKKYYKPFRDC